MNNKTFDIYKYLKIFVALLCLSIFAIAVSFCTLETAHADELETEIESQPETTAETETQPATTVPAETEPETIYNDGSLALTPDGTIIEVTEEETYESEIDVSGTGNSEQSNVLSETGQMDSEGTVSDGSVPSGSQDTQVSDSTVIISDSTVYIQPLAGTDDESNVAALGSSDVVSLPENHCITYEVTFNGTAYTAVFPLSAADSLAVSDGVLLNVGSSAVTGRLFTDSFDTGTYGECYVTLNSVLTTSGNNNAYRYGSWSYVTYYTPYSGSGSSSLSGSATYGNLHVVEEPAAFSDFTIFQTLIVAVECFGLLLAIYSVVRREKRY